MLEFINAQGKDEKDQWTKSGRWIKGIVTAVRTFYEANDAALQGKMRVLEPVLYRKKTKSMTIEQARRLIAVLPFTIPTLEESEIRFHGYVTPINQSGVMMLPTERSHPLTSVRRST